MPGLYLAGGSVHPGPGVPMAAMSGRLAGGGIGGGSAPEGPGFDREVARNGYAWWYVDALSADGRHGLTIIAFVGSVFSPYYALARARGRGDPENHVCLNVALYGAPRKWAMTERGRASLRRDASHIAIGASAMRWDGEALTITIDETTVPLPSKLKGTVTVRPRAIGSRRFDLDAAGRHRWRPIGAASDVTVAFETPDLAWTGTGYFDTNDGDEPLEAAFRSWSWSRFDMGSRARVFYDVVQRDGTARSLSLDIGEDGIAHAPPLPYQRLATTPWGIERAAPSDPGAPPVLLETLENAPFYARSSIRGRIDGVEATGVHESLSLSRVVSPIVRFMLPFKMFRRTVAAGRQTR